LLPPLIGNLGLLLPLLLKLLIEQTKGSQIDTQYDRFQCKRTEP
jgi:hypothetical protein